MSQSTLITNASIAGIDPHARVRAAWVDGVLRDREGRNLDRPSGRALEFQR